MITNRTLYSNKAEKYARYRWDYAAGAIEAIFAQAGLTPASTVADLGAGTGILTRHFVGRVGRVTAIEPGAEMRAILSRDLGDRCTVLSALAEAIPLPDASVDLVTVAQAIHWFNPQPARAEIRRILKPGGWLAVLRNSSEETDFGRALDAICTPENGVDYSLAQMPSYKTPLEFYFEGSEMARGVFPFAFPQDFEGCFGALCSTSYMPGEEHPLFHQLEQAAREVYERFYPEGHHEVRGQTELVLGRVG